MRSPDGDPSGRPHDHLPVVHVLVLVLCIQIGLGGQTARAEEPVRNDSTTQEPQSGPGKYIALGALGAIYGGLSAWSYVVWWRSNPKHEYELGGDGLFGMDTYAGGADKLGHLWANYALSRSTTEMLVAAGWRRRPASLIAGGMCLTFYTLSEVEDGFYFEFSYWDMVANVLGVGASLLWSNVPEIDDLIDFRLEYVPSKGYRDNLIHGGDLDFSQDYSGQTNLLSLHLKAVPGLTRPRWMQWARFVDVTVGYHTENFMPPPAKSVPRRQELFVGLSLNLQHLLSLIAGWWHERPPSGAAHKLGHLAFELLAPPYTTLPLGRAAREQ